jgi:hypothetical protein
MVQFLNLQTSQQRLAATVSGLFGNTLTKGALSEVEVALPEIEVMQLALQLDDLKGLLHEHVEAARDLNLSCLASAARIYLLQSSTNYARTTASSKNRYPAPGTSHD